MIKTTDDFLELEVVLGNLLVEQSGLERNRILNVNSVRGQDLDKKIENIFGSNIFVSYNIIDNVILFEIQLNNSDENISMIEKDDSITNYVNLTLSLSIYGNTCEQLANIIYSRLLSSSVKYKMLIKGIYIKEIETPEITREFINTNYISRCDIDINISIKQSVDQISKDYEFDKTQEIIIKEKQ